MTIVAGAARSQTDDEATEQEAWAILASADGLGPAGLMRLLGRHGSGRAVLAIACRPRGADDLVATSQASSRAIDGDDPYEGAGSATARREWLDPEVATAIVAAALTATKLLRRLRQLGVGIMTLEDVDYPVRLLALEHPPPILFVRGDRAVLSAPHPVAVVGTRRASETGLRLAGQIATDITRLGGVVVSGLALGIDAAAHEGAVRLGRPTVAVLGSGHGRVYPAVHRPLADRIVDAGGCVISELAPEVSGAQGTFPRRNRIISGLSEAVVVVEAPRHSGALITADWALDQGRDCFLIPGPIGQHSTEGNLHYLRAYPGQARLVASLPSLMEDLGFRIVVHPGTSPSQLQLGAVETLVAGLVADGRATVDGLVAATRQPVSTILSALTLLEMRGLVTAAYGRYRASGALLPAIEPRGRRPPGKPPAGGSRSPQT